MSQPAARGAMGGLRAVLAVPGVYSWFQRAVGAERLRRWYVAEHVRPRPGDVVLDIGCGPADILDHLPAGVEYHGADLSPEYIAAARKRHGGRGTFAVTAAADLAAERPGAFDLVMANALLHHLSDADARHLMRVAATLLKPGGRWVSFDCVHTPDQSRLARAVIDRDRGEHIRDEAGYVGLLREVFPEVKATVRHDLLRIPYTHLVLVGTKGAA